MRNTINKSYILTQSFCLALSYCDSIILWSVVTGRICFKFLGQYRTSLPISLYICQLIVTKASDLEHENTGCPANSNPDNHE